MVRVTLERIAEIYVREFTTELHDRMLGEMIKLAPEFAELPGAAALNDALVRELRRRMAEKGLVH